VSTRNYEIFTVFSKYSVWLQTRRPGFERWQRIFPLVSVSSEPDSSVSLVSGYGLDDRATEVRSPAEAKGFVL
jgi:hypothetical protein